MGCAVGRAAIVAALVGATAIGLAAQSTDTVGPQALRVFRATDGAQPLFLVDGVPVDSIDKSVSDADPNDIETVDILRGEVAEPILGTGARLGAVLITTSKSPITCAAVPLPYAATHIECRAKLRRVLLVVNGTPLDNDSTGKSESASLCFDQRDLLKVERLAGGGGEPVTLITLRQPRTHPCDPVRIR